MYGAIRYLLLKDTCEAGEPNLLFYVEVKDADTHASRLNIKYGASFAFHSSGPITYKNDYERLDTVEQLDEQYGLFIAKLKVLGER